MRFQRRRFFRNQPIRNKSGLWWPCLLTDRDEMSNLYRGPSTDASYQVSVHLHGRHRQFLFLIGRFKKIFSSETACPNEPKLGRKASMEGPLLRLLILFLLIYKHGHHRQFLFLPVVAMFVNGSGRNEQSLQRTFHRCFLPSFGSFGQVVSEEKIFFRNQPIIKKCMWWPCLLTDQYEMSNLYSGI
jgi:hypothetical protein